MIDAKPEQTTVNGSGTPSDSDLKLTSPRSADVHALTAMRADLLDMRSRHGADSAIGHRCTNLAEQIAAYGRFHSQPDSDYVRRLIGSLEKSIRRQWADLIGLTG